MFPEQVHYSRAGCPIGWKIRDWETANKLLSYFDPERRPFAIFTLPDIVMSSASAPKRA
jgi:hypothetical protein